MIHQKNTMEQTTKLVSYTTISNTNTISLAVTVSGATQYRAGVLQANNNNTSYIGLGSEL
jgi:hypothetical protein